MLKAFTAAAFAVTMSAFAAQAATDAECEAAIASAQDAAENNIILSQQEAKREEYSRMLADASQKGIEGDYEKCLQLVKDARGGFGVGQE